MRLNHVMQSVSYPTTRDTYLPPAPTALRVLPLPVLRQLRIPLKRLLRLLTSKPAPGKNCLRLRLRQHHQRWLRQTWRATLARRLIGSQTHAPTLHYPALNKRPLCLPI